jgi:hypothetical protein
VEGLLGNLTGLVAALLTLFILSRIFGDNPLFRGAQYLFVGVSLGYGFVVLYHQVLVSDVKQIGAGIEASDWLRVALLVVPFVLSLLFLLRVTPQQGASWLANIPLGIIFGVGAALSLVGALVGTLLPQMLATIPTASADPLLLVSGVLLALGVIATLSYFYFTVPRTTRGGRMVAGAASVGRWLLMVAFGFFFASALITYLTALSERFDFLIGLLPG